MWNIREYFEPSERNGNAATLSYDLAADAFETWFPWH